MKSFIKATSLVLLLAVYIFLSVKFDSRDEYDMERDSVQDVSIDYYEKGIAYAQEQIADYLEFEFSDLEYDVEDIYGIKAEEAVRILENYADGEPITEAELHNAIWAISSYYSMANDVIREIDNYWID